MTELTPETLLEPVLAPDTLDKNTAVNITGGVMSPHWTHLTDYLNSLGNQELSRRWKKARQIIHEHGAAFNILGRENEAERPWTLDPIPAPISSETWQTLEEGISQRTRLLALIYKDIYGSQTLIHDRSIPAQLVFANPGFLRQCQGMTQAGLPELHLHANDLVRLAGDQWRVICHDAQTPAGAGYALENRIVLSKILPRMFHSGKVQRLAPFFKHLTLSLMDISPQRQEEPTIAMLSQGPSSPFYFEHVFLARYLGYTLVESSDLTVRRDTVYMKTLGGLHRVDVIVRQISDLTCDPMVVGGPDFSGVPGLIQAARSGKVAVCNPLGAGILESPGLTPFLPRLCRTLLNEDLILPDVEMLWCGLPGHLSQVIDDLRSPNPSMTLISAFGRGHGASVYAGALARDGLNRLIHRVKASPYAYAARLPFTCATLPAWSGSGVTNRFAAIRIFSTARPPGPDQAAAGTGTQQSALADTAVMAGALTRVSDHPYAFLSGTGTGMGSKDTWCLADRAADYKSMLHQFSTPLETHRGSELPSRVADNMLWLGRYMERSEGSLRVLRSVLSRISGETRLEQIRELAFLTRAMSGLKITGSDHGDAATDYPLKAMQSGLLESVFSTAISGSVRNGLVSVRQVASRVKDRLSNDSWHILGRIEKEMSRLGPSDSPDDVQEMLDEIILGMSAFTGLSMESMTRGMGWRFMDMGRRMERAAHMTILLQSLVSSPQTPGPEDLEALLEIADSTITYHTRYRTTLRLEPVLDLLLMDELNPRAVGYQTASILSHVESLPRNRPGAFRTREEKTALDLTTRLRLADTRELMEKDDQGRLFHLADILEKIHTGIESLADTITQHYLSRVETEKQLKMQFRDIPGCCALLPEDAALEI